jgi:hypothetical protein
MTIIRPNSKPAFWWLVPWAYACELHRAATALKRYADHLENVSDLQQKLLVNMEADIATLKARIADQNDAIIRGTAINPDAHPHE